MMTDDDPASTRLYNMPCTVTIDGSQVPYKMLIYTNDLSIQKSALMVVPLPFTTGKIGLFDISTIPVQAFRSSVNRVCDDLLPKRAQELYDDNFDCDSDDDEPLVVHRVGNYDISVAQDLQTLRNKIDWNHFSRPVDWQRRLSTLEDKELYPFPCAYVVASAAVSVENDGFGVVYPDPGFDYFPTAHEAGEKELKTYDVNIYNFTDKERSTIPFRPGYQNKHPCYTLWATNKVNELQSLLPTTCQTVGNDENEMSITHTMCKNIGFSYIQTEGLNQNVILA